MCLSLVLLIIMNRRLLLLLLLSWPRKDTEQVLEAIPNTIRWALDHEISSFAIQVGPVGEFVVGQGPANEITGVSEVIVGVRFNEDFLGLIAHARGTRRPMAGGDSIQ